MSDILSIGRLEAGINRYKAAHPFHDGVLPNDLRQMAEVYGHMAWNRLDSIDCSSLSLSTRAVLAQWCGVQPADDHGAACVPRADDVGFSDCEACQ